MEKEVRSRLVQQVKEGAGGNTIKSLLDLSELLISDCRKDNDSAEGKDVAINQGQIKAFKKIQSLFKEKKKKP